jgi:hypothetical protein
MTHRRIAGVGWFVLAAAAACGGLYTTFGHQSVAAAVAQGTRPILRLLLTGGGPFTLPDYQAAADRLVVTSIITLAAIGCALAFWPVADRRMPALYQWVRGLGVSCGVRRRPVLLAGSVLALLVLISTAWWVLDAFPNSGDEYCYTYQAETFALGRVANPPHAQQPFFDANHIRQVDGRVFSVFPPGWPAVLALALAGGVPLWLVNPLLGVLTLWLTFLVGRRLYDDRVAAAAAVVLAVSPFFLFTSASFFAHSLCALLVLAYAYSGLRALATSSLWWAAGAGAALGAAVLTRSYTAVLCGIPFAAVLLRRGRPGWFLLCATAIGGLPFVLIGAAYNDATMGHPLAIASSGLPDYDRFWFPDGWVGRAVSITAERLGSFVAWTPPVLLILFPAAWRANARASGFRFTDAIVPAMVAGYFIYVNRGGNQYGPRFYYEALPFVVLAVMAFVMREPRYEDKSPGRRLAWYACVISVLACVPLAWAHARTEATVVDERAEPFTLVEAQHVDNAVVFLASGSGWVRPMGLRDLTRNDPERGDPVLFVRDAGAENVRLMRAFPRRQYFRYRFDPISRRGSLSRLAGITR